MTKLFKTKPAEKLKSVRYQIRLTAEDDRAIRHSASIRHMAVSEFIRRAALGRRADVDYEIEIVLALGASTRAIRDLHAAMVERQIPPPEDIMKPLIDEAIAAILRIEGRGSQ